MKRIFFSESCTINFFTKFTVVAVKNLFSQHVYMVEGQIIYVFTKDMHIQKTRLFSRLKNFNITDVECIESKIPRFPSTAFQ